MIVLALLFLAAPALLAWASHAGHFEGWRKREPVSGTSSDASRPDSARVFLYILATKLVVLVPAVELFSRVVVPEAHGSRVSFYAFGIIYSLIVAGGAMVAVRGQV